MGEKLSADYVLQLAEQIERNGQNFYFSAAQLFPEGRGLFLVLAKMEADHQEAFTAMRAALAMNGGQELDPDGDLAHYIRAMAGGTFFEQWADPAASFREGDSPQSVLQTAIGLERQSILFYEGLGRIITEPADRKTVEEIISAEVGHIGLLAKFLQSLSGERPTAPTWRGSGAQTPKP